MKDCGEKTGELNDIIWLLQKTCQSKLRKKQTQEKAKHWEINKAQQMERRMER